MGLKGAIVGISIFLCHKFGQEDFPVFDPASGVASESDFVVQKNWPSVGCSFVCLVTFYGPEIHLTPRAIE